MRKILIFSANPERATRLRVDQEIRDIREGLRRAHHRDDFQIAQRWAVRPRDLLRAIQEELPQIIHFSGHVKGEEGLYLEDNEENPYLVKGAALSSLFKLFSQKVNIECVLLNGCYSATQAQDIIKYLPYVVGIKQSVESQAAIEFSVSFYDALGSGSSVEFAFEAGKVAMAMHGSDEENLPILCKGESMLSEHSDAHDSRKTSNLFFEGWQHKEETLEVFFSYSHEDESLRDKLASHLKSLERQKIITTWHARDITGGDDWKEEILENLNRADIILLLISDAFITSDFIWGVELEQAMARHNKKSACVIPIILRPVEWKGLPFSKLQALPRNAEPITNWTNQDQAFTDVAKGIRKVADKMRKRAI
ncbi:MAG: TIR domain-containing protein [Phormidesmis sp.]